MKKKLLKILLSIAGIVVGLLVLTSLVGTVAYATGLVDNPSDSGNLYSQYPLSNYQLDFYVDDSWDWLPWNWKDGLGKSVMYGLYAITNFLWIVSLYLSQATGYVIQEAYSLDFISDTADSIGRNIQTIAGVTTGGLSSQGFYVGFLLLLVMAVGIYVAYVGLLKRETSKAISAVINFVAVFILSASFIAYAPSYISKINQFSADVSEAALSLGTRIVVPNSNPQGQESVEMIRDSLFSVQVKQPWLLLQFDNSNEEEIGSDRVNDLLGTSPDEDNGEDREEIVKAEIEDEENTNLTITKTMNRLGTVVFLLIFNIGISIFIFLLTGIMLFSQVLFVIFAMFLPVSFILSMFPTYQSMGKKAIIKLFNTIMMRAGITLVITTAFSISTMFYTISTGYPFFMIAFLQIVTFAGIYFKLGDIMGLFNLQSSDSQSVGRRILRRPQMMMNRQLRRMNRTMGRNFGGKKRKSPPKPNATDQRKELKDKDPLKLSNNENTLTQEPPSKSRQAGRKLAKITDTKEQLTDKFQETKEAIQNAPTNLKYSLQKNKEKTQKAPKDFKRGLQEETQRRQEQRQEKRQRRHQTIAERRKALEKNPSVPSKERPAKSTSEKPLNKASKSKSNNQPKQNQTKRKHGKPKVMKNYHTPEVSQFTQKQRTKAGEQVKTEMNKQQIRFNKDRERKWSGKTNNTSLRKMVPKKQEAKITKNSKRKTRSGRRKT